MKQLLLKVDGKPFRCPCGCNVFHKPNKDKPHVYQCNACGARYEGEKP